MENSTLKGGILAESNLFYFVESLDPILRHAGMIISKRHIETPFDLNKEEWTELKSMISDAKKNLEQYKPDGYTIGWNVGKIAGQNVPHAHLHIIARFADEPLAYKGIRFAFKQESNKRPS